MQISTSALPTLTTVTLMRCVAILWDPTIAPVKQDSQAMEKHALVSGCRVVKKKMNVPVCSTDSIFAFKYVENDGHNLK